MNADREAALAALPHVSRETWGRLDILAETLIKWQKVINLVAPSTLDRLWMRHIVDSLQLIDLAPAKAVRWVDLGSGGGFPGLVLAAAIADRPGAVIDLVESDQRKCSFLREAARQMGVPVRIHNMRIEAALAGWAAPADVVTARALAPVPELLRLAYPLLKKGTLGLFLKGQDVDGELTKASESWTIDADLKLSISDPRGRVLVVTAATPR